MKLKISSSVYALCPLVLFFILFIGCGIYFTLQGKAYAFYQISASVAILPAIMLSFLIAKTPFTKTLSVFLEGARDNNIMIMCLIYLLAGAFAIVLQNTGGVNSIVNLALNFVPKSATLPALFFISALVSMAMGTSMGTIAAIGPIGVGIANAIGLSLPLSIGAIVGGAMFGDNLSMISDTSIAATQIQGCSLKDKFKNNAVIAFPAMIATLIILSILGWQYTENIVLPIGEFKLLQCLPYLIVLGLALIGKNVFVVLVMGIISAGLIGVITVSSYDFISFSKDMFEGYKSMTEILILSLLMGGLGGLIKEQGGFAFLVHSLDRFILSKKQMNTKGAEAAISALVSFTDICTANNTAAIILSGEATKEIAIRHQVSPVRAATLVDIFSCVFQGILPYSAQVLMAGSLSGLSPLAIVPNIYYCFLLGITGVFAIAFRFPRFSFMNKAILNPEASA